MQKQEKLTKQEQLVLDYIVHFRREQHYSPSMRQIAGGVGLASVSTVHTYVHSLARKGWILPYNGIAGSIVPASECKEDTSCGIQKNIC